jgi:hypothetical protein
LKRKIGIFVSDFSFLHCIAALRSKKTGEIWGEKTILQPIEKRSRQFNNNSLTKGIGLSPNFEEN